MSKPSKILTEAKLERARLDVLRLVEKTLREMK